MKRKFARFSLTTLLIVVMMMTLTGTALANLSGSTFEGNDGNLVVNTAGNTDWDNVAGLHVGTDLPTGKTDNSFGQGTKEDDPVVSVVSGSIPPNKNDLTRFYVASEQAADGDIFLYLGWERLVNIGNANLDFEINQAAQPSLTTTGPKTLNRTAGDLLVTYDFGGSGTPTLGLNIWLTSATSPVVPGFATNVCLSSNSFPCWGDHISLNGTNSEGAVNATTGLFGEAAINLTDAGVFQPGVCEAFGSTFVKSRSSSSFPAEIKDFIAPIAVNISNCGTIKVHKTTENGDSSFGYTTTGSGLSSFSLSNSGTKSFSNLNSGSYSVTENLTAAQQTAGWTLKSLSCTSASGNSSFTYSGPTANISLALGDTVDCYYTNHINLSPTIATVLSATTVNIGDSVYDTATLSGATSDAGGTVTYHAYAGQNTCSGTDLLNSTKTVTNGVVPDSDSISFNTAGYYSFQAVYSGDANNNSATSVCSTEQLLVKTNPSISTLLSGTSVEVGSTVHDSATLSGATSDAGGSVTYTVYTDSSCSQGAQAAGTVTVTNGVVPDSNGITFNNAGDYYWQAVYSGDSKNGGATSTCTDEHLVVTPKHPSGSTAQNLLPNDSFTLSGATSNAGGTITFKLFSPSDASCSGAPAYSQTVNVSGNGTYITSNTSFFAVDEGTWRWLVTYTGDNNNTGISLACGVERFTIANQ